MIANRRFWRVPRGSPDFAHQQLDYSNAHLAPPPDGHVHRNVGPLLSLERAGGTFLL
jgi:hypothetical protein